jgi:hypothetical protein
MTETQWKAFFATCAKLLNEGEKDINSSPNWCSWTTFTRLTEDSGYWQSGLPNMDKFGDKGTTDGAHGVNRSYLKILHISSSREHLLESF